MDTVKEGVLSQLSNSVYERHDKLHLDPPSLDSVCYDTCEVLRPPSLFGWCLVSFPVRSDFLIAEFSGSLFEITHIWHQGFLQLHRCGQACSYWSDSCFVLFYFVLTISDPTYYYTNFYSRKLQRHDALNLLILYTKSFLLLVNGICR